MLLDTLKGFVPALLATIYVGHLAGVIAGAAAMLGHWRPLFLKFARGGKVVATSGGAFLGVAPLVGGIAPRWTGMWAACATIRPCTSNSAAEWSRRSLMFAE